MISRDLRQSLESVGNAVGEPKLKRTRLETDVEERAKVAFRIGEEARAAGRQPHH